MTPLPFNKPFMTGRELEYIASAVKSGKISGNGAFTKKCHDFFKARFGFAGPLLTSSCTDALEMAAIVAGIQPGDEVIMPSFTFVSTANAFVLRGARIVFADSEPETPNMDCRSIEALITPRTRAIVPVHYAGVACNMDAIAALAGKHRLMVIEDAAQAIDSYYRGRPLGSLSDFSAFSFHETKNVISGEGGMFVANNTAYYEKAEIAWEKGTNRSAFWRGEVDRYGWVDIGSSFLPSEITAAFLFAQLEHLDEIQAKRLALWERYNRLLAPLAAAEKLRLPSIPAYATNNAHMFYVVCRDLEERIGLITHLKNAGIHAVFHYLSLHKSPFYQSRHDGRELPWSDVYTDRLLRLPMYYELSEQDVDRVSEAVSDFYNL
jgi:dTDP-4-amino-4,6-dideoxygalactose transaminase